MTRSSDKKTYLLKKKEMGQVRPELLEEAKTQSRAKTSILNALKKGPLTIPEISAATGLDSRTALFYLMTLRRYGQVRDAETKGDYFTYALKEG